MDSDDDDNTGSGLCVQLFSFIRFTDIRRLLTRHSQIGWNKRRLMDETGGKRLVGSGGRLGFVSSRGRTRCLLILGQLPA